MVKRPRSRHLEEVYITPFQSEYHLPKIVIYRGHTDPLQHLRRFKRQCQVMAESYHPPPEIIHVVLRRDLL